MIAGRIRRSTSPLALSVLALPLALLVPMAAPFSAQQAASLGLPESVASLGAAGAATAKPKKKIARKPAATKRVCSKVKGKGKLVTRCKTVKVVPAPVVVPPPVIVTTMQPIPVPAPVVQPVYVAPPPPQAAPVIPAAAFYWIDQADSYAQVLGDSPPDFTFRYDGIDCWAWVSRAGEVLIVEPGREGVVQYYFDVRESSPYLVRDSYNSYAFDGVELVQVYDNRGRIWTSALTSRQRYDSHDLRERGRALYSASMRQHQWDASSAFAWSSWSSSYGFYDGWNNGWNGVWRENKEWPILRDRWRREHPPRRLEEERRNRREARDGFHIWRNSGGRGAPPPTGIPQVSPPPASGSAHAPAPPPAPAPAPVVTPPPPPPAPVWGPRRPVPDVPQPAPAPQVQPDAPPPPPPPAPAPVWRPRRPDPVSVPPPPPPPEPEPAPSPPPPPPPPPPSPPPPQPRIERSVDAKTPAPGVNDDR